MSMRGASLAGQNVAVHPSGDRASSAQEALARPITVTLNRVSLTRALDSLSRTAKVLVQYKEGDVRAYPEPISLSVVAVPLGVALEQVLRGTHLRVVAASDGDLAIVAADGVGSDSLPVVGDVTGRVVDSVTRRGLSRATVKVVGTKLSALTTDSGSFTLRNVPAGDHVVQVRSFGYRMASYPITVKNGEPATLRVSLVENANILSGVVTTATGMQERRTIGNDITVLNADSVMRVAPVTSMTDLLATRVPGLIVQKTSGAPGAPSRLRLRGSSSVLQSDDPILIVDGVRMYADQSGTRATGGGGTTVNAVGVGGNFPSPFVGPSALDQLDPNIIETVTVLKGPSATAIYGSDAANGVIVVTTKRGRPGPLRWSLSLTGGRTTLPGDWPMNYYRFGHDATILQPELNGPGSQLCSINSIPSGQQTLPAQCVLDSIVPYQALNNPALSPFGTGWTNGENLGISGGNGTLTYSVNGGAGKETGYLHLPDFFVRGFEADHGFAAPQWMKNPEALTTYFADGTTTIQLGSSGAALSFNSKLNNSVKQESPLSFSLDQLAHFDPTLIATDSVSHRGLEVSHYGLAVARSQIRTQTYTTGAQLQNWKPRSWLPIRATVGISVMNSNGSSLTPAGYDNSNGNDTLGHYTLQHSSNTNGTLDAGTTLAMGQRLNTDLGFNVQTLATSDYNATTGGLPVGVTIPTSFLYVSGGPGMSEFHTATYGWYVQPRLRVSDRLDINPGFRLDGGSASGSNGQLNLFPRTDLSYRLVERPATDPLFGLVTLFRPRIAFGIAGVQPAPADKLRLLRSVVVPPPGGSGASISTLQINTLGNTEIHPERSRELEGGADLAVLDNRMSLTLTYYNKMRYDAIMSVPVPPSALPISGPTSFMTNVGQIRNTGVEAELTSVLIDTRALQWSVGGNVSHNDNVMVRSQYSKTAIVNGVAAGSVLGYETRIVPGYPLNGLWARPILGYADRNGDGVLEPNEVSVGDSTVFIGSPEPTYQLVLNTGLSVFNRSLTINTSVAYQNGLTQVGGAVGGSGCGGVTGSLNCLALMLNNPATTMAQQAAVAAYPRSAIGLMQTVNVLRWNDLSISYVVPSNLSRRVGASFLSIALQGSNLGLHTNYRGKDPDVNAFTSGNYTADTGQQPAPRFFVLSVRLSN